MVSMVLAGARDIPLSQARGWGRALGLQPEQMTYFEALLRAEVGETLALRRAARLHVAAAQQHHDARRMTPEELPLLAHWFVPVLLEMARIGVLTADADAVAARLWPPVDVESVRAVISELVERGALQRTEDGRLATDGRPFATDRDVAADPAEAVRAYHVAQLEHAALAMRTFAPEERHVASLVVAVPATALPALIRALHAFHLEVIEPYRTAAGADARLVQVSVQLFPRTT
jgi:uncharacterized protein (TIGR02147 family)